MTGALDLDARIPHPRCRKHLRLGRGGSPEAARKLGSEALAGGLTTLDLARLHERVLVISLLPSCRAGERAALIRRAATFFGLVMTPIELTSHSQRETIVRLKRSIAALGQRTVELAASNLELSQEVTQQHDRGAGAQGERAALRPAARAVRPSASAAAPAVPPDHPGPGG